MSRHLEFPRPLAWDRDYWLCRCEGFRVEAPTERLGVVEAVRFGSRLDRPDELLVRGGVFGNRRLVIPVADVEEIAPRQQRLVLRRAPERGSHRHLGRMRPHLSRRAPEEAPHSSR
jgi:hypothetical protein